MYVDFIVRHWRVMMWSFIVSLFFIFGLFSCYPPQKQISLNFNKEYTHQLSNFTFLIKEVKLVMCDEESELLGMCDEITFPESSASGVVLSSTQSHIFILTANHFCEDVPIDPDMSLDGERTIQIFIGATKRDANVVMVDEKNDICLLQALKFKRENFRSLIFAEKMPDIGDKVYNFAAPNGIGSPNTRLIFDGYFAGCEIDMCMYSIPATFGSSGSAVYNEKGELVSLLVAAAIDFENVSMGPDIQKIKDFIRSVDEIVDIY